MSLDNDWHLAHTEDEKYNVLEQHTINSRALHRMRRADLARCRLSSLPKRFTRMTQNVEADHVRRLLPQMPPASRMPGAMKGFIPQ